jgi:hypothetical protein
MTASPDMDALSLRNGDVRAWTGLAQAQVRCVKVMPMPRGWSGAKLIKYHVALDDGQVLEFVGKRVNAGEARVLEVLSGKPPIDIPRVYFVQDGWCVMEALPPGKPPVEWTAGDARAALTNLACLHAAFWDCAPDWLDRLDSAGLNRRLDQAARGLGLVERMGGWPGLIEPGLMRAMRRTLDHRERFVAPLLDQPVTLLHGDAWMSNWNIAGDRCALLDWSDAVAGPAVWDVNYFSEIAAVYRAADGQWQVCLPPVGRDEVVTFYLDQLEHALGQKVDRAAFTSALAAAFVVNTLTLWMGFVEDYGAWTNLMSAVGWLLARLPGPLRRALEGLALQNQGDFLRQTFAHFESCINP